MSKSPFDKLKIDRFGKEIEPQEVLLDSLAQRKEKDIGISEKKLETPISVNVLRVVWVVTFAALLLFFGRTFQLQVIEGKTLLELSEKNRFIIKTIRAERGVIYDKYYNQLVFNKSSFDLVCSGETKIKNIDHETLLKIKTSADDYPGCEIKDNTTREYLSGPTFAHLIGYQRQTEGQASGLESYYDDALRAKGGELRIERDALGNLMSREVATEPESGNSLVLWLDSELQKKIATSLQASIERVGAAGGAAVALDPKTGGILALVSLPSFDNNVFTGGLSEEQWQKLQSSSKESFFNRVISGRYLTGSTIKPLMASAALQDNLIDPQKEIYCGGKIIIPNPWDHDNPTIKKDWDVHGWSNMEKAIAESCNVYFYTIGGGYQDQKGLGPTKIKQYLELFGWDDLTGIDLPGEARGFIPDKDWKKNTLGASWWDGDTYNLAIGQGYLLISPIEVVSSIAAIANGGKLLKPQIVRMVIDSNKNVMKEFQPEVIRENFIDGKNLQIVGEGMRQGVTGLGAPHASSVVLNSLPVPAAAKTGTAEIGGNYRHNWVTVFAPYDDPQIVLTVLVEKVPGDQAAVLPVAKEVLNWYFSTDRNY